MAATRLGVSHPLVQCLRKGVAFHHAALPADVQDAIEDEFRSGSIGCLVATSTLTEGVNLPVRTIVVASQGIPGEEEFIVGSKLLNALGRAGRAGRETEGWVVLVQNRQYDQALFDQLERSDEDLEVRSALATKEALESLAQLEEAIRATQDAIFDVAGTMAAEFVTFVSFIASALEDLGSATTLDDINSVLTSTLAWHQLDDRARFRWQRAGHTAYDAYMDTEPDQRRRWSRAGTSIATARSIDQMAGDVARLCVGRDDIDEPRTTLDTVIAGGRLEDILRLPEAEDAVRKRPRAYRNAPVDLVVAFDAAEMLRDWMSGIDLQRRCLHSHSLTPTNKLRYVTPSGAEVEMTR